MHKLGNWLLVLCVLLLIPTLILTTLTLDVRHRWLKDVSDRQQRVEQGLQQIAETEARIRALEEQRQSLVQSWGDVWTAPNSGPQAGTPGGIELGVGSSSGLPQRGQDGKIDPSVFVFAETPAGTQYLGEFGISDIRPSQAIARMTRVPYPQEAETWPRGVFHVRGTLPANWLAMVADLQGQQVIADSILVDQQLELSVRQELIKSSQATLALRMAELNGNPDAEAAASDEVRDGLVESLRKYETARDQQLKEVDRLRHEMFANYSTLQHTLERCFEKTRVLEEKSRQPAQSAPTARPQGTSVLLSPAGSVVK